MDNKEQPEVKQEPTLGETLRARGLGEGTRDFRPRENNENDDLPSVNRKKGKNNVVTWGGFALIAAFGMAMIYMVNKGDNKPVVDKKPNVVENNLPTFTMPPPAPPPPPEQQVEGSTAAAPAAPAVPEWQLRKMNPELLVADSGNNQAAGSQRQAPAAVRPDNSMAVYDGQPGSNAFGASADMDAGRRNGLGDNLSPAKTPAVTAAMLPNRNFLLTKGTNLDCALETAINSGLPGMTTCRLSRDVYSDNGKVLLLERGTRLVGEYRSGIQQGQVRIFVLWTRATTPQGVAINLDSPGADELGRSGVTGWVNNHFAQRFGAAIMLSMVQDAVANLTRSKSTSHDNSTTNVYNNTISSGEKIIEKMLESSINIPPTIIKNHGDNIRILIARDLDFSTVYALKLR